MILEFPDAAVLRRVLAGGVVPSDLAATPVQTSFNESKIELEPTVSLSRTTTKQLDQLGVVRHRRKLLTGCSRRNWYAAMPLMKTQKVDGDRAIFVLPPGEVVGMFELIARMGGKPRLSLDGPGGLAMIHVRNCPVHAVTLAADRHRGIRGYVESGTGVWVEIGHTHDFLDRIGFDAGVSLVSAPFDVDLLSGRLDELFPEQAAVFDLKPCKTEKSLPVPGGTRIPTVLRLKKTVTPEPTFWVVPKSEFASVVAEVDQSHLDALEAAMFGETMIVRFASRKAHPVLNLVTAAVPYVQHPGQPNIHVPYNRKIQPSVRPSVLRSTLGMEPGRVLWLSETAAGAFQVNWVADTAFEPVAGHVDYIAPEENKRTGHLIQKLFEFDSYFFKDDQVVVEKEMRTPVEKTLTRSRKVEEKPQARVEKEKPRPVPKVVVPPKDENAARALVRDLEERFRAEATAPDSPAAVALWEPMADAYAAVGRKSDAVFCLINAVWFHPERTVELAKKWNSIELASTKSMPGIMFARTLGGSDSPISDGHWMAVERHEVQMPLKAAWLAALAHYVPTKDVLGLARVRDRITGYLADGLSVIRDVPASLKSGTTVTPGGFSDIHSRLPEIRKKVVEWMGAKINGTIYSNLYLAWICERLGDPVGAAEHMKAVVTASEAGDSNETVIKVRNAAIRMFTYRINQAGGRVAPSSAFSEEIQKELVESRHRGRTERGVAYDQDYAVSMLRQALRVLDPQTGGQAHGITLDQTPAAQEATRLSISRDGEQIVSRMRVLLAGAGQTKVQILTTLLPALVRTNENFAAEMLDLLRSGEIEGQLRTKVLSTDWPRAIVDAIGVAGHFGMIDRCRELVDALLAFVKSSSGKRTTEIVTLVASSSIGHLRRFGMTDLLVAVLETIEESVRKDESQLGLLARTAISAGWVGIGFMDRGLSGLDAARTRLLGLEKQARVTPFNFGAVAGAYVSGCLWLPNGVSRCLEFFSTPYDEDDKVHISSLSSKHCRIVRVSVLDAFASAIGHVVDSGGNTRVRDWMTEDEFLIRKRIKTDLAALQAVSEI